MITLTTDFGHDSLYAAAMKGVILSINPEARIVDLSHSIPPHDVLHAAFFLAETVPYFPAGTLHVGVVDPGVGTDRSLLYVEIEGHRLVVPDNGIWTLLARDRKIERVLRLAKPRYWRSKVGPTFHGRDILAPVAAHLSLGLDPSQLGPPVTQWVELPLPEPVVQANEVQGQVVFVDHFGNLITNIPGSLLTTEPTNLKVGGRTVHRWVRIYGEAKQGELVALISSSGFLEIAVVQGNAAMDLQCGRGAEVHVT